MERNKHIKNYSVADIEKYHAGQLTPAERNALEKAALEDPILADALEGYGYAKSPSADLAELRQRLADRVQGGKIIVFPAWLRAAAMIIIVIGAGLLVYQFAFNKDSGSVAMNKETSGKARPVTTTADSVAKELHLTDTTPVVTGNLSGPADTRTGTTVKVISEEINNSPAITKDSSGFATEKPAQADLSEDGIKKETGKLALTKDQPAAPGAKTSAEGYASRMKTNQAAATRENYFRGRVVDANNKPVPFASIINTRDNAGTYSDAKGDFNLVSPDSVLEVQIRSIGFENNYTQLRNDVASNQVVMQNDNRGLSEVVISNKRLNAERSRDINRKLEEPEPADGWENYDRYIVNNLKVPGDIRSKETSGEVELSFEVNNNGEPVNIKIEKSLCSGCDQEAIRLIKEGPKWKPTSKRARTTVRVPF